MDTNRSVLNSNRLFSRLGGRVPGNASGARGGRSADGRIEDPIAGSQDDNRTSRKSYHAGGASKNGGQRGEAIFRPERIMGFMSLQKLVNSKDINRAMLELTNKRNGFSGLLNSNVIEPNVLILLVKMLRNVCDSSFNDVKTKLLGDALNSRFMDKLILFITSIMNQSERDKSSNRYFWTDTNGFWNCLIKLAKTVQEILPTHCEPIQKLLKTMGIFFPLIEANQSLYISDEIKVNTAEMLSIVERTIEKLEMKKNRAQKANIFEVDVDPPDDFREIEIIPSAQEVVVDECPFLRPNIIDRPYASVDQYLDIQFRLLREDFVAPLRRGICTHLRNQSKPKRDWEPLGDITVYMPVRFIREDTVNECNCYLIRFAFVQETVIFNYENSKKFMFGSLVCFTKDNFKTLLFGKIVERDVKTLQQGMLKVGFTQDIPVDFKSDYLMVESTVYFEPYYQVLKVLKQMDVDDFPMKKYIIDVQTDFRPPEYLVKAEPVMYRVENVEFPSLDIPEKKFFNFNESQLNAYKAALTEEFCIIQGPPGTGKTYLGLKIAQTLLENQKAWYNDTPILVICYTNHALDQFLEGLIPVTRSILRVGGQSKNEALTEFCLGHKRRNMTDISGIHHTKREVREYMERLKTLFHKMEEIKANESLINFRNFRDVVENFNQTWFSRAKNDAIIGWLMEGKNRSQVHRINPKQVSEGGTVLDSAEPEEGAEDPNYVDRFNLFRTLEDVLEALGGDFDHLDILESSSSMLTLNQLRNKLTVLHRELGKLTDEPDSGDWQFRENLLMEIWETETDLEYLELQMQLSRVPLNRTKPHYINLRNPFKMRYADRWRLYFYWVNLYTAQLREEFRHLDDAYRETFRVYNEMRDIEDTQLMKQHLLVGMTTTGAARLQSSLQCLKSPIVIVEEAAEVLEAHIVAALTNHCKHLILIGDHLQLKPGTANYEIETKFKLGISLFERLVINNIKLHTLDVQHRMRPELSRLIKPHIYPNLTDHETTLDRPPILGVDKCLFFIDHKEPERSSMEASKKNTHESKFLIALARHLVLNGYKPEQITILAAYLGQYFEMKKEQRISVNFAWLKDVRIAVLDNYQGEESDIILLSLVRSNYENKAGFLKIQNRVCVALSRARNGMYIMGNMSLLLQSGSENEIWDKVNAVLQEQDAIGTHLTLRCQNHRHKFTQVSSGSDFVKVTEGGCDLKCEATMPCGHACKKLCHVLDEDHKLYECHENCLSALCNDPTHVCQKLCYEECGPCTYLVSRDLDCGHNVNIECHIDVGEHKCTVPVLKKLPCGHETETPCSADLEQFECPFPCETRVEPCGHACKKTCHFLKDPDHLNYKCQQVCHKPRVGCTQEDQHFCNRLCYQDCEHCMVGIKKERSCGHVFRVACMLNVEEAKCERPCKKLISCGHPCKKKCHEDCGPCSFMVEKIITECEHKVKIKCHLQPERQYCINSSCPRLLPCGHKCSQPCGVPCTEKCEEIVKCDVKAPCGHVVKNVMCHIETTNDPKALLKYCTQPCGEKLVCEHTCSGTCGDCMQSRVHVRCTAKCGVPLVCNHECPIPCRQACKPCIRPCGMRCVHSVCRKKCGEPCTPCQSKCPRKCEHVRCTRRCGQFCDVPPCEERCQKALKCGHQCVGFCGAPCPPLCRICNKEELTEIFFGFEDEEDAIFVLLVDCKHVFESTKLDEWMNEGQDRIQFKTCPRCKTTITTTERYSEYLKEAMLDIVLAKKKSFGEPRQNEILRKKLLDELNTLRVSCKQYQLFLASPKLLNTIEIISARLQQSRNNRRQSINKIELNAIQSKIQTLAYIAKCFSEVKKGLTSTDLAIVHLNMLLGVLLRSEDHITDQEVVDLEMEIKRLHRTVQLHVIQEDNSFAYAKTNAAVKPLIENIQKELFRDKRYTDLVDATIKEDLKELAAEVSSMLTINDKERMEIVTALGFAKGHWYKCPNGHPYTIGECGRANQVARCFCGAGIGGLGHNLLHNNEPAIEMDVYT